MDEQKPAAGSAVIILRTMAVIQFIVVVLALTAFTLENIAVFEFLFASVVLALILWSIASLLQVLRGIEINTRKRT